MQIYYWKQNLISEFNFLDLKQKSLLEFQTKYKFYEIMFQENVGKDINSLKYEYPFIPPENIFDYIEKKWIEYKKEKRLK